MSSPKKNIYNKIGVICFGSTGDVKPLLLVLDDLLSTVPGLSIYLLTHADHKQLVCQILRHE